MRASRRASPILWPAGGVSDEMLGMSVEGKPCAHLSLEVESAELLQVVFDPEGGSVETATTTEGHAAGAFQGRSHSWQLELSFSFQYPLEGRPRSCPPFADSFALKRQANNLTKQNDPDE